MPGSVGAPAGSRRGFCRPHHDGAFAIVRRVEVPYTLIACPYIKDGPRTGKYEEHEKFPGGFKTIHPGDVADCVVRHLAEAPGTQRVVGIWC